MTKKITTSIILLTLLANTALAAGDAAADFDAISDALDLILRSIALACFCGGIFGWMLGKGQLCLWGGTVAAFLCVFAKSIIESFVK